MDDLPSMPPPSYSSEAPHSLVTIVAPIPTTIPRPVYVAPAYEYHGRTFDLLPPDVQDFLTSHGLGTADTYSTEAVALVRTWLTDQLMADVRTICEAIVHGNVRYNLLRTMYPASDPSLCALITLVRSKFLPALERQLAAHLTLADGLVWADVSAREGSPEAVTTEQALHYRWLQTQPPIELVATHLVELYEWSATMWMMGWRSDGSTTYLQAPTTPDADISADVPMLELDAPLAFESAPESNSEEEAVVQENAPSPIAPADVLFPAPVDVPTRPSTPQSSPPPMRVSTPQTPQSPARVSLSTPQTPQSPRSVRRLAMASPPTSPPRTPPRSPPRATLIPTSYSFSSLQVGQPPRSSSPKYATVGRRTRPVAARWLDEKVYSAAMAAW
ncbi:hypothetical protein C8R46DRAFT_1210015 [Mycena filopes]|nr:hypothetical protein C8R46DRAFT_1210015 [Mycena filopes]